MAVEKRSKRLKVVEHLAEKDELECAKALGEVTEQLQAAQQQLQQLHIYMGEYQQQKDSLAAVPSGAPTVLANYMAFFQQLEQAIRQQQALVERLQQQRQLLQVEWGKRHNKRKNYAKLIERYRLEEQNEEEKRLQKSLDDRRYSNPFD